MSGAVAEQAVILKLENHARDDCGWLLETMSMPATKRTCGRLSLSWPVKCSSDLSAGNPCCTIQRCNALASQHCCEASATAALYLEPALVAVHLCCRLAAGGAPEPLPDCVLHCIHQAHLAHLHACSDWLQPSTESSSTALRSEGMALRPARRSTREYLL